MVYILHVYLKIATRGWRLLLSLKHVASYPVPSADVDKLVELIYIIHMCTSWVSSGGDGGISPDFSQMERTITHNSAGNHDFNFMCKFFMLGRLPSQKFRTWVN